MNASQTFLTAEWRQLIMANYRVDPAVLAPLVPAKTVIDYWEGNCYISLVGFRFQNVRLKGMAISFHRSFPEVNLRFYVKCEESDRCKRGVVFIKEIVPKPAVAWTANWLFRENYVAWPMRNESLVQGEELWVSYQWKKSGWHSLQATVHKEPVLFQPGSKEEFITDHFWGYARKAENTTVEYQVEHPAWKVHPVHDYQVCCDFKKVYGSRFRFLNHQVPESVFMAEGSPIKVFDRRIIG